jgi:GNAT superfamily N-acetyltransferase
MARSLGPHVVGQRVVVRRILPGETGPTGGPAFTDVLGVCESWTENEMAVRTEDGALVSIALADIVSGKPVPPRPSPRLRVSAREAESHAALHWPGVQRESIGTWELRTEPEPHGRLRKRANSCLAIDDPGIALADAESAVLAFYRDRERPPLVQVETGSEIERWFTEAGWSPVEGGDALFLMGSVSRALRLLGPTADEEVTLRIRDQRADAVIEPKAFGKASLDEDWLGVHGLEVEPAWRRRGLARAVLAALLEWGAERGASTLWLHVETGNDPAITLYESLGLTVHHGCRYLSTP